MKKGKLSPKGGSFFVVCCQKNTNYYDMNFQKKQTSYVILKIVKKQNSNM